MSDNDTPALGRFEELLRRSFGRFLEDVEGAVKEYPGIEELEIIAAICESVPEATAVDAKRFIDYLVEEKKITREGRYLLPKNLEI